MSLFKQADIQISRYFFENGNFRWENNFFADLMDKGIPEVLVGIALLIFVVWLYGKLSCKTCFGIDTKVMFLTSGTMFLGPILIVNGIFKSFWGRARPYDVIEFGGEKRFTPPLAISDQCQWDCSFMSGHTAVAFWTLSLALLAPRKYRSLAVSAVLIFGTAMAVIRIGQGAHFFSDVLFSGLINISIVLWVYNRLFEKTR